MAQDGGEEQETPRTIEAEVDRLSRQAEAIRHRIVRKDLENSHADRRTKVAIRSALLVMDLIEQSVSVLKIALEEIKQST